MAADLSNLDSFLPPPPAFREHFCPLVGEQGSLCLSRSGSDSGLRSPLTPSEALTRSDDDDDYLAELTIQMANDMLREQNDDGRSTPGSVPAAHSNRYMQRWVDLFAVSPQSTLQLPSGWSYCNKKASVPDDESQLENSGVEGDSYWDTQQAYEPRLAEISDKIESVQTMSCPDRNRWSHDLNPGLRSYQTFLNDGNWSKEQSRIRHERAPNQANPAKHAKNNQWRTRRGLVQGEYYVGLSLPMPQKGGQPKAAGSDEKVVPLGEYPNSRTGSAGTGVFLPKTAGNPTEQGRKPRCSTVLIPARVAQALMVHFSKTSHPQSRSSVVGGGGCFPLQPHSSLRCGAGPNFQPKGQADQEPEPVINCNEMGLPQEWMY